MGQYSKTVTVGEVDEITTEEAEGNEETVQEIRAADTGFFGFDMSQDAPSAILVINAVMLVAAAIFFAFLVFWAKGERE